MEKQIGILLVLMLIASLVGFTNISIANERDKHNDEHKHEHEFSFSFFSLIRPLGICTLSSLLATFFTGLFRRKLGKRFLTIHRIFAWLTVLFGLTHGIMVMVVF